MPAYFLVAIDGTGSRSWMKADGSNSFTRKFYDDFKLRTSNDWKLWKHGPDVAGSDVDSILTSVKQELLWYFRSIKPEFKNFQDHQLIGENLSDEIKTIFHLWDIQFCFVGHSRGAAMVAHLAAQMPKRVKFLGLYDSVSMNWQIWGYKIKNVDTTYHAIRDMSVASRITFLRTHSSSSGDYFPKYFKTPHGGVGGDVNAHPTGLWADYSPSQDYKMDPKYCIAAPLSLIASCLTYNRANSNELVHKVELMKLESEEANQFIRRGANATGMPII